MTDFRQSQTVGEVWVTNPARDVVSQAVFEAWITRFVQGTVFIASQAVTEVWMQSPPPVTSRRYRESAQAP